MYIIIFNNFCWKHFAEILFQMVSKYKNADPILQTVEFTDNL